MLEVLSALPLGSVGLSVISLFTFLSLAFYNHFKEMRALVIKSSNVEEAL